MSEPTFRRAAAGAPLYLLEGFEVSGSAVAFLPRKEPASLPERLTLGETWRDHPGIYLILGGMPQDTTAFAAAVASLRRSPQLVGLGFLWLENPDDPADQWILQRLLLEPAPGEGKRRLRQTAQLSFRGVTLLLGVGSEIGLLDSGDAFVVVRPSPRGLPDPQAFQLVTSAGRGHVASLGENLTLPMTGETAGCLQIGVDVPLEASETEAGDGFDRLDVGLRYFADGVPWREIHDFVDSFRYPVFDLAALAAAGGSVSLEACLDPSRPLAAERTFFTVASGPAGGRAIPSHYRTHLGQPVTLTPESGSARLVFSVRPLLRNREGAAHDPFYLTPQGSFELAIAEAAKPGPALSGDGPPQPEERLMCGFSGVEYAGLLTETGNRLHFFPRQAAYAPALQRAGAPLPTPAPQALTDRATTSWSYLTPPSAGGAAEIVYYAQPDEAVLHQAGPLPDFLDYLEVPAAVLPPQVVPPGQEPAGATATAFPMVPYTGLRLASLTDPRQLEVQILSPLRRDVIYRLTNTAEGAAAAASAREGATPQGVLAGFDASLGRWERLVLATSQDGSRNFELGNLRRDLKAALQSNQLFLVVSSREKFLALADVLASMVEVAGWNFELSPDRWQAHGTLMVLKFYDAPLAELAADPTRWSAAAALNDDVAQVSRQLQRLVADAEAKRLVEDFAFFAQEVLERPSWNGVLFLNAFVPLTGLPDQLKGLAAGIDPAQFFAHHLGVNLTPVTNAGGVLRQGDSSFFGLISYDDPEHQFFSGTDYRFKVLSLKVLFRNSAIASFSSRIELMINRLFGEPSNLLNSEVGNNLVLDGVYQRHGDEESYVFRQQGSNVFAVTSAVMAEAETLQAQFLTVIPPGGIEAGQEVETRFLLWGNLRFQDLAAFDLFSYGDLNPPEPFEGQLAFANLTIEMRYAPAAPSEQHFFFNAGRLSFDLARTEPRPQSLARRFPLRLTGLVQSETGTSPGSLGYITVRSPLVSTALEHPWFGLVFDVDLGTLGALSGDAAFKVQILAAWAPAEVATTSQTLQGLGGETPPAPARVSLGLKLPGSQSAKAEIPLQGVLKLTFKAIELTVADAPEGKSYVLKLRGIAVSLMGIPFPPGQTDFLMFGDPAGQEDSALGWLAAYVKGGGEPNASTPAP